MAGNNELQEIENFNATWEAKLAQDYKSIWNSWKSKRDIVAKEMKLNRYEIACVTRYELVRYVSQNLKRAMGINDQTANKVANTRGNTKLFQFLNSLTNDRVTYKAKCSKFLDRFEKRVESLNSKR